MRGGSFHERPSFLASCCFLPSTGEGRGGRLRCARCKVVQRPRLRRCLARAWMWNAWQRAALLFGRPVRMVPAAAFSNSLYLPVHAKQARAPPELVQHTDKRGRPRTRWLGFKGSKLGPAGWVGGRAPPHVRKRGGGAGLRGGRGSRRNQGLLVVTVLEAKGLRKADVIGKSDPFVELWTQAASVAKTVPSCRSSPDA